MRNNTICISERILMFCIAGQLYDQAPARLPRKADIIMQKVREQIRKEFYNDNEYYTYRIEEKKVCKYIDQLLKAIPEFQELNLSQIEFEKGISVDDENRGKYKFTTRYDVETPETWKTDFIDLDAFTRNVANMIFTMKDAEEDCFGCIYGNLKGHEKCKNCIVNPEFKNHYECGRKPRGNYTFACKYDCYKSRYICCEECKDKETCTNRCDGNSETCGNAINRGEKEDE